MDASGRASRHEFSRVCPSLAEIFRDIISGSVGGVWLSVLTILPIPGANTEGTFCSFPGNEMTQERHCSNCFSQGRKGTLK